MGDEFHNHNASANVQILPLATTHRNDRHSLLLIYYKRGHLFVSMDLEMKGDRAIFTLAILRVLTIFF